MLLPGSRALPAASGSSLAGAIVRAGAIVAAGALVAAAWSPDGASTQIRRPRPLLAGAAMIGGVILTAGYGVLTDAVSGTPTRAAATSHPFVAATELYTTYILLVAMLGLLLRVAVKRCRRALAQRIEAAVRQERQRIARDLHDGLAQDLAFIVAYGQRLQGDLGPEHPLMIAASRALAVSRGVLVDLSASTADSTADALRQVADELSRRFEIAVAVVVEKDGVGADDVGLDTGDRGEIVRIAREAVVNAVQHGGARTVEISLTQRDRKTVLCVRDDGCGVGPEGLRRRHGFGLPTMRARAESLGGRLTARAASRGGTELAVTMDGETDVGRVAGRW